MFTRKTLSVIMVILGIIPIIAIPAGFGIWLGLSAAFISFGVLSLIYALVTAFIINYAEEYL